jgi:hypothetical protein
MSNFYGHEMSRIEMKKVRGGQCYIRDGNHVSTCSGVSNCKSQVADNWGQNYCCASCGSASWCAGGQCPQP